MHLLEVTLKTSQNIRQCCFPLRPNAIISILDRAGLSKKSIGERVANFLFVHFRSDFAEIRTFINVLIIFLVFMSFQPLCFAAKQSE